MPGSAQQVIVPRKEVLELAIQRARTKVIGLLILLFAITYLDRVCISVAGPRMQDDLHIDPVRWGWVTGMFALAYCLFELPTGALGDRIGPRRIRRGHRARAELADDLLPDFGVGGRMIDVQPGERQPGGLQAIVMAGDAVLVQSRRRGCLLRGLGRNCERRRRQEARHSALLLHLRL